MCSTMSEGRLTCPKPSHCPYPLRRSQALSPDTLPQPSLQGQQGGGKRSGGALLFCVVGAKMSEGINFADDLARYLLPPAPTLKPYLASNSTSTSVSNFKASHAWGGGGGEERHPLKLLTFACGAKPGKP